MSRDQSWEKDGERLNGTAIPFGRALGTPGTGLGRYRAIAEAVRLPNSGTDEERAALEASVMDDFAGLRMAANAEALTGHE